MKPKVRKSLYISANIADCIAKELKISISAVIEASLIYVLKGVEFEKSIKKATHRSKYAKSDFMRVKARQ